MRKPILTILFLSISSILLSQKKDLRDVLYKLEDEIIKGDLASLKEISKYLDDKTFVQEFLGYHNYPNTAKGVTKRILQENCLFSDDELKIDSTITSAKFLNVLNSGKVKFDNITGTFLITKLEERKAEYELKKVTDYELKRLDTIVGKKAYPDWYYENQIDGFLLSKNPEVLKWIASAWFHKRPRFNRYYFSDEEFTDLIKKLTRIDVGVPDEEGNVTFLYQDDYYAKARLNYLIYWTNHYNDYKWNEIQRYFENSKEAADEKGKEELLFGLLNSKNDSIAIDAFDQLGELDPVRVAILAEDYDKGIGNKNFSLPTFPFRFLKQMTLLTEYCRKNGIKYRTDNWLNDSLAKLKMNLPYYERYQLENNIINGLKVDEITAVEYFGLVYGGNWNSTFSMGRILDKFYSKNWKELVNSKMNLESFLKKSVLFDRLGIIGICNKYLRKFENCSSVVIDNIKEIAQSTNDLDIKQQANEVILKYSLSIKKTLNPFKPWDGSNNKYGANDLTNRYLAIKKTIKDKDDKEFEIKKLIGEISYDQLGEALKLLQSDTAMDTYYRFHFIESDFGFNIPIRDPVEIEKFLKVYSSRSEYEVYEYYLKQLGMNCLTNSDSLDYPGIYENLKYNVIDAFVGGGGGRKDDGVYLIIKLLELRFKTTLGFPKKLCSWQGIYGCDCEDRAKAWMNFLEERKLVVPDRSEPPSISNND